MKKEIIYRLLNANWRIDSRNDLSDTRPIRLRTAIFHHPRFIRGVPSAKSSPRVRSFGVSRPGELKTDERNKATPSVNHHHAAYPPIHSSIRSTAVGGSNSRGMLVASLLSLVAEIAWTRIRKDGRTFRFSSWTRLGKLLYNASARYFRPPNFRLVSSSPSLAFYRGAAR